MIAATEYVPVVATTQMTAKVTLCGCEKRTAPVQQAASLPAVHRIGDMGSKKGGE